MMPLSLYRSRNFSAANALTLLVYFALGGALYYLPFGLIRLGGYSATQAGAALLPFALIMGFGASFAGALSDRFGPRLSLTVGPIIAACGLILLAFTDFRGPYWTGVFPAICVLAIGMTTTVPPLTSTVMASVGEARAGIASGVNNAVARVAGLLAIAVFSVVLARTFEAHVRPQLEHLAPARAASGDLDRELSRMAGADLSRVPSIPPRERLMVRTVIDEGFVFAFRLVMIGAACLALAAAAFGGAIRQNSRP